MTLNLLKKFVLPPVFISAAVFSVLALPLAIMGSKTVVIQLQEEPVFSGQLRDIATPYLGLASVLSAGAGVTTVTVTGWRQSASKSAQVEKQLSSLQQYLQKKEELLEELRLSESQLEVCGLSDFVNNNESEGSLTASAAMEVPQPVVVETPVQIVEPLVAQPAQPRQVTAQSSASLFSSAQDFLAYVQANPLCKEPTATASSEGDATAPAPAKSQFEELQSQLKQLTAQMETLQNSLQIKPEAVTPIVAQPYAQRQISESWLMQKIAS